MTVKLELTPDLELRLREKAAQQGQEAEKVLDLLRNCHMASS